ncbi:MerR family transcriptional regulator [Lactobacillus sp. Sy-1]|uniref:MerR family transcriptional regulator n=1 Tax=Lactobacillus sp. Sy-1 TaxID=2109645 RepID=UPI001C564E82|nr:MerR family transcriptional regulator [Lactobacillus sp. Sy-1]MBW1605247.1 MerR family transcriptional regulator [Lactobacillus sp. Sy-1]
MKYSVKEAAEKLGMSQHTVRYYTDQGLVPSLQRDQHNNRQFSQNALDWLTACHYLRQTGMSVKAVKHYVDLCLQGHQTIQERYQLITAQQAIAQQQLITAQKRLAFLNAKEKIYHEEMQGEQNDPMNPNTWQQNDDTKHKC